MGKQYQYMIQSKEENGDWESSGTTTVHTQLNNVLIKKMIEKERKNWEKTKETAKKYATSEEAEKIDSLKFTYRVLVRELTDWEEVQL